MPENYSVSGYMSVKAAKDTMLADKKSKLPCT